MASIFQGNRIRDHRGTKYYGKPLVYGIGTTDPKASSIALQAHEYVFSLSLSEPQKRSLKPKWIGMVVKAMVKAKTKEEWRDILSGFLPELSGDPRSIHFNEPALNPPALFKREGTPIPKLLEQYNHTQAHHHYGPYFPSATKFPALVEKLIDHLLKHGTLMLRPQGLDPIPEYNALLKDTPRSSITDARRKVTDIQGLLRYRRNWEIFCREKGITTIQDFEADDGKAYIAWRKATRFHGEHGRPISTTILKKELGYFRSACQSAVRKRLISYNPMEDVKISRMESRGPGNQPRPIPLNEITSLLRTISQKYEAAKANPTFPEKRLLEIKWNHHLILFLLCTGCRPSEAQSWTASENYIQFFHPGKINGIGKTKNSNRRIPITETLRRIIQDGTLLSQPCISIASRLHQYLERLHIEITPYQFRHTVATLLFKISDLPYSEIAYRLGHATVDFTFRTYTEMDYYGAEPKERILAFWAWIQHGILDPNWEGFKIPQQFA